MGVDDKRVGKLLQQVVEELEVVRGLEDPPGGRLLPNFCGFLPPQRGQQLPQQPVGGRLVLGPQPGQVRGDPEG